MIQMKEQEKLFLRSDAERLNVIIPAAGAPHNQASLEALLQDRPLAMLDISGKSLLQRNVETLNKSKLYDISVTRGYKKDAVDVEGVTYLDNSKYQSEHILSSIMCAEAKMDCKTLIIYSDILFESWLIERLKALNTDFVIVVDIGIAMFSERGTEVFKNEYHKALEDYKIKQFYEAENILQASLEDMLQHIINSGYSVEALQVNSGWMEIHTFDNYKYACSIV